MKDIGYQTALDPKGQDKDSPEEEIKGDFLDFDRIFYNWDNKNNEDSLLLFSEKKQLFKSLNLQTKQISDLELSDENAYRQVEMYDGKLFCISKDPLSINVFFDSKSKKFFHKKTIYFANKDKRLKDGFTFLIWKQQEQATVYRCLLGPLTDGRYMNFDLSERFFDAKTETQQMVKHIFCVSLTLNNQDMNNDYVEAICMDEVKKAIICYTQSEKFFEYNGFIQEPSQLLRSIYIKRFNYSSLRKMHYYCPYDYFPQKVKNKLKNVTRGIKMGMDAETFLKNAYREILLCIEGEYLLKLVSLSNYPMSGLESWRIDSVGDYNIFSPYDAAVNNWTGEIYCLCKDSIKILKDSGRNIEDLIKKPEVVENIKQTMYNS